MGATTQSETPFEWESEMEPGKPMAWRSTGLLPIRLKGLDLDAPMAVVSVSLDGWAEGLLALDIERERGWSWATLASRAQASIQTAAQTLGKRPRGVDCDYTADHDIDYRPQDGKDQAFCLSLGDSWGPSSLSATEAMRVALWSVARALSDQGVALVRLPPELSDLILSEQNRVHGFLDPEPLAENARSLFLPYLEALGLQDHLSGEAPSRPRPGL